MQLTSSPWGLIQSQKELAPGIIEVSTMGHGGIFLSSDRWHSLPPVLQLAPTFCADPHWFEEDCDQMVPVLAFPEAFTPQRVWNAVRTARGMTDYPLAQACAEFLKTEASQAARDKAAAYEAAENPGAKWEAGSRSCGGNRPGWEVHLHRGPDNKVVTFAEYPTKQFYADEELPALLVQPARRVVVPDARMFEEAQL